MAVAGQIDEAQVRVVASRRSGSESNGAERAPVAVGGPLVEAGRRAVEVDEIELAVAGQVEQLAATVAEQRGRRSGRHRLDRAEAALTEVRLVEPRAGLLGEDAGDAFAVEIDPVVGRAVDPAGRFSRLAESYLANASSMTGSEYSNSSGGSDADT